MTFRYRLYPASDQVPVLCEHGDHARFVWNLALGQMRMAREMGQRVDWKRWERELAELRNAPGMEWLREGSSSIQQQALRSLRQAWRNRWKNPKHFGSPNFKSKRHRGGFTVRDVSVRQLNRKWSAVHIPKVGWVKFRRHRPLGDHGMGHVTRNSAGQWHISFSAPQHEVDGLRQARTPVGIDRGITDTLATSDRQTYSIPKPTPREVARHHHLQARAARQQPGSKRNQRTRQAIAKLELRWSNRRKNWVEQTSTELVRDHDLIVFEKLNVRGMMASASGTVEAPGTNVAAKSGLNREIGLSAWGMLTTRTRQKAEASGTAFIEVPAANTSRKCSQCGHTAAGNRRAKRFKCLACGYADDADFNAAYNILAAGLVANGRDAQTPNAKLPSKAAA